MIAVETFDLPMPPSVNRNTRFGKGRTYSSPGYVAWKKEVAWLLAKAPSLSPPYQVIYRAGRPDKRRRDIDNLIKPLNDAMQAAGVIRDDYLVESVSACWAEDVPPGRVLCEITGVMHD